MLYVVITVKFKFSSIENRHEVELSSVLIYNNNNDNNKTIIVIITIIIIIIITGVLISLLGFLW